MYRPRKFSLKPQNQPGDMQGLFDTPVTLTPAQPGNPYIFASPHSGRIYPPGWLAACRISKAALRSVEDIYVDDLMGAATQCGAAFLRANFPRSLIDANRAADDLPEHLSAPGTEISVRASAGLGVIPMSVAPQTDIYRRPPSPEQALARIDALYRPYHDTLQACINTAKQNCGRAIIIDCHSMPGFGPLRKRRADFIVGDRYSKSCPPELTDTVEAFLRARDYTVTRNHPYAGGYTTQHYGRPDDNVFALQIEINRDLYVNPITLKRKQEYERLQHDLTGLISELNAPYQEKAQAAE